VPHTYPLRFLSECQSVAGLAHAALTANAVEVSLYVSTSAEKGREPRWIDQISDLGPQ